jgi:hypothetical protein
MLPACSRRSSTASVSRQWIEGGVVGVMRSSKTSPIVKKKVSELELVISLTEVASISRRLMLGVLYC